jgi:predicted nucleotidyltransferase
MITEFEKFVGNRMLGWMLLHPTATPTLNSLARTLGISPGSVKRYVDCFAAEGLVAVRTAGTAHLICLDNAHVVVRELKRACMTVHLADAGLCAIAPECTSLAVYGSVARGTYDEQSDIDVLVIGEKSEVDYETVPGIEAAVGYELQLTVLPYYRWETMKEEQDPFVRSVMCRHILFAGAEL